MSTPVPFLESINNHKETITDMFLNNSPSHLPQHHDNRVGRRVRLSGVHDPWIISEKQSDHYDDIRTLRMMMYKAKLARRCGLAMERIGDWE